MKINEIIKDLNHTIGVLENLEPHIVGNYEKHILNHFINDGYMLSSILNARWDQDATEQERLCVLYYYNKSIDLLTVLKSL